jgi:hypothetical protein
MAAFPAFVTEQPHDTPAHSASDKLREAYEELKKKIDEQDLDIAYVDLLCAIASTDLTESNKMMVIELLEHILEHGYSLSSFSDEYDNTGELVPIPLINIIAMVYICEGADNLLLRLLDCYSADGPINVNGKRALCPQGICLTVMNVDLSKEVHTIIADDIMRIAELVSRGVDITSIDDLIIYRSTLENRLIDKYDITSGEISDIIDECVNSFSMLILL